MIRQRCVRSTKRERGPVAAVLQRGLSLLVGLAAAAGAWAEDWPTYRHDAARSGITSQKLALPLAPCWIFKPRFAPQPAWGDPRPEPTEGILELRRFHFDDVFEPVVADGAVYFGSSGDNKVYCLDAATGRVRWTASTGGPVRLAPAVAGGRVYVGSDDGWVYCLRPADGSVVWKLRAAPDDRRVLGHGKLISLWPVRTGVLVDGGAAYFAAGIFPAEGVLFYAVDAATGREIWRNDATGETPQSGISPQGYLLASSTTLYAPMGRVSPAAIDRRDGRVKFVAYFGKPVGGTFALLADDGVYTGTEEMVAYPGESKDRLATFAGRKILVTNQVAYLASDKELSALDRRAYPAANRKLQSLRARAEAIQTAASKKTAKPSAPAADEAAKLAEQIQKAQQELAAATLWTIPSQASDALILAGDVLFAGGAGEVIAVAAESGKSPWQAKVEGTAKALAAANGRLYASTDKGLIYCFGPDGAAQPPAVIEPPATNPYQDSPLAPMFRQAAETILDQSGVKRGYCLVLGCETGQLAYELAGRSELMIYAVAADGRTAGAVEKALDASGVLGGRVVVQQWPLDKVPYADYFADLIVSESALVAGRLPDAAEMFRMLKPLGGVALIGQPGQRAEGVAPLEAARVDQWLARARFEGAKRIDAPGAWAKIVRGPLPGAGSWTHLYANAANTACGDDQRVKAPLGVLWFGHPGPGMMLNRHERAAGPLAIDGRLFVQGESVVMALDAYNGLKLWERAIAGARRPNASHDGSNMALNRTGLFVAVKDKCLRLDPATGRTLNTYDMPDAVGAKARRWGYVACTDEVLFGSRASGATHSDRLFALDIPSGQVRWTFDGKHVLHNCVAVGDGQVFLIDSDASEQERQQAIQEGRRWRDAADADAKTTDRVPGRVDVRRVVCLDAGTGNLRWKRPLDVTACGAANLALMYHDGVLVTFGVYLDGHYWKQFFAGDFAGRRVIAMSADDGEVLWSKPVGFRVRPLVIGDTLHAEPWAYDLRTGEPKTRIHPVTGRTDRWQFARPGHHCGCPCASPNGLFFRSYCLGYYDLARDAGTMHFAGQRPGCWINFIPAAGLLLVPEASSGCMCPFPNMCTVVFQPTQKEKAFAYYSAAGPMTPVKRLGINLGAPGDRKDASGNLWLGFPRPSGALVLPLKISATLLGGGAFVQRNSTLTPIAGADTPWLFTSAAQGLGKCTIPLLSRWDGTALYRVRLGFADPENDQPGQRVFDVKLQGKTVLDDFDIVKESGGRDRAVVKEFDGIEVTEKLAIELVPKIAKPTASQAPILQAVEIIRQKVLGLGCSEPGVTLSSAAAKAACQLELSNLREAPFEGSLQLGDVPGFTVSPKHAEVKLDGGAQSAVAVEVAAAPTVKAGAYAIPVQLVRRDGSVELTRAIRVEHLGRRARLAIRPVEDAYVSQRYPDQNKGAATVLVVDGGDRAMGDTDHSVAYLKFRLDIPGKAISARLRLTNAGNPSGDAGRICLVVGPWAESRVTYGTRPDVGEEIARIGAVTEDQAVDCLLKVDLAGKKELSLAIDPTSCDGVDYLSRESDGPPELIVEYEPREP